MNNITLVDIEGKMMKGKILFTYYDYLTKKDYLIYLIDNDVLASIYEIKDGNYLINNDLSSKEYDMIDKLLKEKLGEKYE